MTDRANMSREQLLALVQELEAHNSELQRKVRSYALSELAEISAEPNGEATYAPMEEWRFKLAYLDPDDQDRPTHVCAGVWQDRGCLAYTLHEFELEQQTETRLGTDAAGG